MKPLTEEQEARAREIVRDEIGKVELLISLETPKEELKECEHDWEFALLDNKERFIYMCADCHQTKEQYI